MGCCYGKIDSRTKVNPVSSYDTQLYQNRIQALLEASPITTKTLSNGGHQRRNSFLFASHTSNDSNVYDAEKMIYLLDRTTKNPQ